MKAFHTGILLVFACASFAACSGGSSTLTPQHTGPTPTPGQSTPTPTPVPTATPTATATPAPNSTTVAVNNGAPLTNAPLSTALPAPTGYTQSVSIPIVNAPANTKVQLLTSTTQPASLAPLSRMRALLRPQDTSGSYTAVLYDSLVPSANITAAGDISFTQGFPAGVLGATTQYYLGFYDTTQASPAWQTIAGPVTASGGNLTFSGTISSTTLIANKLYGFAVFSSTAPSGTPPPAPQTLIYYGDDTTLTIAKENGTVVNTLPIGSNSFDLDDAGNVYASLGSGPAQLSRYPAGSASPSATYVPSNTNSAFIAASGSGEVAAVYARGSDVLANGEQTTDVWDPGKTGAPSRTLTTLAGSNLLFAMTHDGTLYLPDQSAAGVPEYDVFPPGASTPSRVITETVVPSSQYANFDPNYAAVGPDGTLYVTEYSFQQPDPNAGTYVYPGNGGPEFFIPAAADANGPGPQGVDVDGSGNIYVVNNNSGIAVGGNTCQGDSLQSVSVYSPTGTLLRTVSGGNSGFPITTAADGTSFVATFQAQFGSSCAVTGVDSIFSIAPGASTSTQIANSGSTEIILYDGTHKTSPFYVGGRGGMSSGSTRGGMARHRRR